MKKTFFYTVLIAVGTLVLSAVCWSSVPTTMPIHWNAMGQADGFAPRAIGLLLIPTISVATSALLLGVAARSEERRNDRAMQKIALVQAFFMAAVHGLMIQAAMHSQALFPMGTFMVLLGAFFGALGLIMPMLHSNRIAGVRTPWNGDNDINWKLTHRAAKWTMVVGGLICALAGLVLPAPVGFWVGFSSILLGSLAPIGVSYTIYCTQK